MAAEKPIPLVTYRPGTTPEPPPPLDVTGSELWRSILAEWDVPDRAGRALLEQACAAYAMAERLRRQIAVDGDMIETGNGVGMKLNPMIIAESQMVLPLPPSVSLANRFLIVTCCIWFIAAAWSGTRAPGQCIRNWLVAFAATRN